MKYKSGDVIYDTNNDTHLMLEVKLSTFGCFLIRMLTKNHCLYGKPLTAINKDALELDRFILVGRNAKIK